MPETTSAESNFLVPNGTILFEILAFAILLFILAKYVIPPVNKGLTDRQENIRQQFADAEKAKSDAEAEKESYRAQIADARQEAARIREEAKEQGAQIIAEMRQQAQSEADRITTHAHAQIEAERSQALAQLKGEVGSIATQLAGRIVGESLDDEARQKRTVERFIAELEESSN
ncbi:F-type H+-transporting ATPase subunit b [Aeromicrobium panaciterrae]|uniref:ATP synthase subunit b n=1 Tax=Aeromicrobium panaciterrae TaxID=363861 RepID=A0ABU1UML5_9ACTN|nr:F0F1 ATP synthase subunit B [Aeromicrobium panaciterrae]MDR7086430.1 F-type H+-transporting ATPase subunit b [Aeromicrobium panaciterrae]